MKGTRSDYSILNKFRFQWKPVGMKYLLNRPEGMPKLDTSMPICRMFREAQDRDPFFAAGDNFTCMERLLLGMMEPEPFFESGEIGAKEKIYQEPRANRRIYDEVPKLAKNTVRYVAFSSIDKVSFEPDVMVITANTEQAEIILRALSYSSGKPLTTKITPVLTCAWIFVYPYVTGETNYTITGLGYGIRLQKLLPEGLVLISIPFDRIPMLIENLKEMEWILPITTLNEEERGQYSMKVMEEINREYKNG
ncbi:MAG: DUF169 domain-containing protein [Deltaproteobacteria bacterium]|nr:DUF169 domain-containing protein [Deltaproteobacteria bacterium]